MVERGIKSFYTWCVENDKKHYLDIWDYDSNNISPKDISYGSKKKVFFKCSRGIHSCICKTTKEIISHKYEKGICDKCNSFGQWLLDTFGDDGISKYWSSKNKISPFSIPKNSQKKVFIICDKMAYHEDYDIIASDFVYGRRCKFCTNRYDLGIKYKDSIGFKYPQYIDFWSEKNKMTPFEVGCGSHVMIWAKCKNNKHEDYLRIIKDSIRFNFECPSCSNNYVGEKKIENILKYNDVNYILQYKFDDLKGVGNKKLSYDFYIPSHNILIEFQGIQHYKPIDFFGKDYFEIQKEHDERKLNYAKANNFKLILISYKDINSIEKILKYNKII